MTRLERILALINKGYTYNPENGLIFNKSGKELKSQDKHGYKILSYKKYAVKAHHFAWYWVNKEIIEQIDHINCNRSDNRICNLRSVNNQKNQWNRKTTKGYHWHKIKNKWCCNIRLNKNIYLGCYDTEEEALNAYLDAKKKYHIF